MPGCSGPMRMGRPAGHMPLTVGESADCRRRPSAYTKTFAGATVAPLSGDAPLTAEADLPASALVTST